MLAYATRHNSPFAVFCIDIDDFGELFKKYGDAATVAAVKSVADILSSCIRQEDMAARIGSSRFALLLPGMSSDETFRSIRQIEPTIPIVLCSGYTEKEKIKIAARNGMNFMPVIPGIFSLRVNTSKAPANSEFRRAMVV